MEELFPSLIFFILWIVFAGSIGKKAKNKNAGKGGPARSQKPIAPPIRPGTDKTPGNLSSFLNRSSRETSPHTGDVPAQGSSAPWGSLSADDPEGTDPCHDDPARMPSGSLSVDYAEGTDPCHDDSFRMPSGSLTANVTEGTVSPRPAARKPAVQADAASSGVGTAGFQPGFSANDVVRGFVWGEILNRKRA